MIKKIISILTKRKVWCLPLKSNIIFLDKISAIKIEKHLLSHKNYSLLDFENETNMLILFISLFKILKYGKYSYHITYLDFVNAKHAISIIDNNLSYYQIFKIYKKCKLILFQNGRDDHFSRLEEKAYQVGIYFFTNNSFKNHANKYLECNMISSGSIINNNFPLSKKFKEVSKIIWVSHFRPKNINNSATYNQFYIKPCLIPLDAISKFVKNDNLKLEIILRTNSDEEIFFYKKILKNINFKVINNDLSKYETKSYESLSDDSIVIGLDSQFLYESFARCFRTIFLSTRKFYLNDKTYGFGYPEKFAEDGFCWSNSPDLNKFLEIFKKIKDIKRNEWLKEKEKIDNIMSYNYNNSIVRKIFIDEKIDL